VQEKNDNSISLNKFISATGICSRREADQWIKDGRVTLNGEATKLGNRVSKGDEVCIDGKPLDEKPEPIYIAFNKPIGIVCTTDKKERKNIVDFIGHEERLFPIGRLDKASQGLILLTNDGDVVNKILRAGNQNEKEYIVRVRQRLTPMFIEKMSNGVPILETVTKRCKVQYINDYTFRIVLTQGLNRQIRRMCEHLEYEVATLKRVRIMNIKLGDMKVGDWKELKQRDVDYIFKMLDGAEKTEEASVDEKKQNKNAKSKDFRKKPKKWIKP
jgi:23S rRNA pseudouridine2604 synthase